MNLTKPSQPSEPMFCVGTTWACQPALDGEAMQQVYCAMYKYSASE